MKSGKVRQRYKGETNEFLQFGLSKVWVAVIALEKIFDWIFLLLRANLKDFFRSSA